MVFFFCYLLYFYITNLEILLFQQLSNCVNDLHLRDWDDFANSSD